MCFEETQNAHATWQSKKILNYNMAHFRALRYVGELGGGNNIWKGKDIVTKQGSQMQISALFSFLELTPLPV
jgi:hypothetical protein